AAVPGPGRRARLDGTARGAAGAARRGAERGRCGRAVRGRRRPGRGDRQAELPGAGQAGRPAHQGGPPGAGGRRPGPGGRRGGGGGSAVLDVAGEPVTLSADELVLTESPRTGWSVATEAGETVALDLTITPELRRAGLAREVVRLVQEARKASGLDISDRISL